MQSIAQIVRPTSQVDSNKLIKLNKSSGPVISASLSELISDPNLVWNTKIHTIELVAQNLNSRFSPEDLAALCLYTSNSILSKEINDEIQKYLEHGDKLSQDIERYVESLFIGLEKIQPYEGDEVYIGFDNLNRSDFKQGSTVVVTSFVSASTSWHVALEACPNFDSKRKGTILIIKPKNGKYIGGISLFGVDGEVVFSPPTEFEVTRWYRGDTICLGQANIREHTFGIKDNDLDDYLNSSRALIIELQEL